MNTFESATPAPFRSRYVSRYSFFASRATRSCGTVYFAETTSSWAPGKYRAAQNTSGVVGFWAAMLSSLPASRAAASCLASGADLDSCADTVADADSSATKANAPHTNDFMGPPGGLGVFRRVFYHRHLPSSTEVGRRSNEERVFVLRAALTGPAGVTHLAHRLDRGAERAEERASLARRRGERRLKVVEGRVDAQGDVAEQRVSALHLGGGKRRGARGVASNGVHVHKQRFDFVFELLRQAFDAPCEPAGRYHEADLRNGDGERR